MRHQRVKRDLGLKFVLRIGGTRILELVLRIYNGGRASPPRERISSWRAPFNCPGLKQLRFQAS